MSKVGSGVGSKPDSIRTAGSRHPVQTPSRNDPTGTAIHKWPLEPSQRDQNRWPWSYEKLRPPTTQDSLPPRPLALSTPNRLKAGAVTEPRHSLLGNRSHRSGCCRHHPRCEHTPPLRHRAQERGHKTQHSLSSRSPGGVLSLLFDLNTTAAPEVHTPMPHDHLQLGQMRRRKAKWHPGSHTRGGSWDLQLSSADSGAPPYCYPTPSLRLGRSAPFTHLPLLTESSQLAAHSDSSPLSSQDTVWDSEVLICANSDLTYWSRQWPESRHLAPRRRS